MVARGPWFASLYHAINTQVNPVAAGALTGGLFKAGAGVRGAALASAIGAGLAAAWEFKPERLR